MATEAIDIGVSDQDLFNEANADEAPADEAVAEVAEGEPEQDGQPRDEQGRFASTAEAEPEPVVAADPPATPPVDDNAAMVPSWRVREINEEKRALADKVAAFEAERLQWQQRQVTNPQPAQPAPQAPARPDPLLDPEGYAAAVRQEIREEMLSDRREQSLQNAHKTYKTEFEEAYAAAQKQVDPVLKLRMQNSRDPGETLIEWHREQKTRAEVGTDLNAFRQREQERLLSDPAFLAKAIEKARGVAQPQTQPGQPRQAPAVSLPPSLTRATTASANASADDDVSDEGLWRHANTA